MLTIVLPGHSPHNKDWAIETTENVHVKGEIIYVEWDHWSKGGNIDIKNEVAKLLTLVSDNEVNFIAKSIGTKVLMYLLPQIHSQVHKVILCGIPISPIDYKRSLDTLPSHNILVIQNSKDPFMPYLLIEKYIHLINKDIKVIKKESNTHDYPYYDEFERFLL